MSESQNIPIQQKIDPPLMLSSEGNKNPQMTSQGMSNVPTSPPPPYPQQSFTSMPPTQAQPQQQYAQPQYQQQQQPQPQYQQQQQPQYQQQPQQYQQQPQQQYQQQQYQQSVQMQSQPVQVESVQVRDVSYTEPAQPSVVYVDQQPQPTTIVMQPTSLVINSPVPTRTTCTNCGNSVTTVVTETPGTTAYILSVILCLLFWPLAWLPCVMSGCLDKIHSCPVCGTVLATVRA